MMRDMAIDTVTLQITLWNRNIAASKMKWRYVDVRCAVALMYVVVCFSRYIHTIFVQILSLVSPFLCVDNHFIFVETSQ
jgi:hypothetical protein